MSEEQPVIAELSADEVRYLIACGAALLQNIPAGSLPTYSHFDKNQIIEFTERIRRILGERGPEYANRSFPVQLIPDELRYVISCGFALSANVSTKSLQPYCGFNPEQILEFSRRMRRLMDEHGLDM